MGKDWRSRGDSNGGISSSSAAAASRSSSSVASRPSDGGVNYILHSVSKLDTLAGVAIKYGVEVSDIKRLNGLVTDLQMFGLKTLRIPLPGKHPPSPPVLSSTPPPRPRSCSSGQTSSTTRRHSDLFDSFPSLKLNSSPDQRLSPAMTTLRGYYGLKPLQHHHSTGCQMALYPSKEEGGAQSLNPPPLNHARKSKSLANGFGSENTAAALNHPLLSQEAAESDRWIDKLVRRRQKSEPDFTSRTPEKLLKEENSNSNSNSSSSIFSAITGKGLALRPKSGNKGVDGEAAVGSSPVPIGLGDSVLNTDDVNGGVRKSSSASSLQDSDNGALSSIWPTSKWSLKPDFQSLSTARPMFDGLPKPMGRRNKTALD